VYHRRADRIRAHTLICFLALVIQRLLRQRLRTTALELSPATVLERLEAIQYHTVRLVTGQGISNLGQIAPALRQLFNAIDVEIPTRARIEATL
jgi:transposase